VNKELFEKGLAIRKSVLGAEYVEKSIAAGMILTGRCRS